MAFEVRDDDIDVPLALGGESVTMEILCAKVDRMQSTMDAILTKFDEIATEVAPLLDSLSTNAWFKMFLGGKK